MQFPLSFWDLSLWLAVTAIILLTTLELTSPRSGRTRLLIERKKLRSVALTISVLFFITVIIHVYNVIITF